MMTTMTSSCWLCDESAAHDDSWKLCDTCDAAELAAEVAAIRKGAF